jgi:hypothetical protein
MSVRAVTIILLVLTGINVIAVAINISSISRAAVAGLGVQELVSDADFAGAVKSIVEKCRVNVDLARVSCQ